MHPPLQPTTPGKSKMIIWFFRTKSFTIPKGSSLPLHHQRRVSELTFLFLNKSFVFMKSLGFSAVVLSSIGGLGRAVEYKRNCCNLNAARNGFVAEAKEWPKGFEIVEEIRGARRDMVVICFKDDLWLEKACFGAG